MRKAEEAYLNQVRSRYRDYCFHVYNDGVQTEPDQWRWIPSKFHTFLCDYVQSFLERATDKPYEILIISTPPQHGKSKSITEALPSWYLGHNPEHRVIEISYSETFAQTFGRRNKEKIKDYGHIFGVGLSKTATSNTAFELSNNRGGMISRGIGSGVTGNPCNLMIIDDPIKNRQEADSETSRNSINEEWVNSFRSRLSAGAKVIIIQTRWHESDLAGYLMETEDCEVLNIPCEAEENDPLGREVGEALCPEIGKGDKWLHGFEDENGNHIAGFKEKHTTEEGSRAWHALYQGRPTSQEGNIIKREWWQEYLYQDFLERKLPMDVLIMSVDATFKNGEKNDFVAIEVWGKRKANIYLIDLVNRHMNFPETIQAIRKLKAVYPRITTILIEDKANGPAIIDILRSEIMGIIAVNPQGGKEARVNTVTPVIESGNVYLPEDQYFTGEFIDQCASFPNGKHDDLVDAMSQALYRLIHMTKRELVAPKQKSDWSFQKVKRTGIGKGDKIHVI